MLASLSPPSSSLSPLSRQTPPLTPPPPSQPSPVFSDDSALLELSFSYEVNSQGDVVRVSRGSDKSSPPTPIDSPVFPKPESPVVPPLRALVHSRSESMPTVDPTPAPRPSFQRIASSSAVTPASTSTRSSVAPFSTGARKLGGARRVKLDELPPQDALMHSQSQLPDEIENLRPTRAAVPTRPFRVGSFKKGGIEKIVEEQLYESDDLSDVPSAPVVNRPHRSASFSDASASGYYDEQPQYELGYPSRPGSSLGVANSLGIASNVGVASNGPRRVTLEERDRMERLIGLQEGYNLQEAEEAIEAAELAELERTPGPMYARSVPAYAEPPLPGTSRAHQSPSPTHISAAAAQPRGTHQRRDSDTLRSHLPSPTAMPPERWSPPARHRRSQTALEPTPPQPGEVPAPGRTWAAGDDHEKGKGKETEDAVARSRSLPAIAKREPSQGPHAQSQQLHERERERQERHIQPVQVSLAGSRNMIVNKKAYARLDLIGKGGSSRVYRVMNGTNEIYAIKRVSLDKTDPETMASYTNEIRLLKRLDGNARIIKLLDSELRTGAGGSKGHLMLVMECGEIDLARLLQEQQKEPLDLVWIAYYWKQMLQAVHVIHEEKIVHSDLKPANFVLVRGQLKLIDFGIANAIANDTTNIQRDHQIGTVNYMSPEAIELPEGMRRLKVGRPSDVWSLGCILYQMVYGQPPFQHMSVYQKMKAIPDETHVIPFPEYATPSVPARDANPQPLDHLRVRVPEGALDTLQKCLIRNPKDRAIIPELLEQDWLMMRTPSPPPPSPPPPPAPVLKDDEVVINPFFMAQLLRHGIYMGKYRRSMDEEELAREAERLVKELQSVHDEQRGR